MYADTFLSKEEFEEMFDLTAYEQVRSKYHAVGMLIKFIFHFSTFFLFSDLEFMNKKDKIK